MRPSLLAAFSVLVATGTAAADPLLDWSRVLRAPADEPAAATGLASPPAPTLTDISGPATSVTLVDILKLTVKQSPALGRARINVEIANAQIAQAQAWSEWQIRAMASGSTSYSSQARARQTNMGVDASILRPLSTGGALGIRAIADWSRGRTLASLGATESLYSETVTATFSQPLLNGRGQAIVHAAERIATTQRSANQVAEHGAAIDAVREVVFAYLNLVAAERDLKIRRSSLELAHERQVVTQSGIDAGRFAKAESIPVEQAIVTREEEVLVGELAVLDQSLAVRRLVQMPIKRDQLLLSSTGELTIPSSTWQQDALIELALANSPELARLKALEAGATIEVEVSENGILPSLDLALAFGPTGVADGPATAAKNMATFDQYTASGSLTYQTSWGHGAARATARRQRAQRETIRISAADVQSQIIEGVARAVAQVNVAERRHRIAERAVELAKKNVEVEQGRFQLGKSRNVDVLTRQDELRAAELRSVYAIIDWHRAATAIAALTGEILPQYGISLP